MMKGPLRVATYNVLAQCFVEPERYAYVTPQAALSPHTRQAHLLDTITSIEAGVVLLQEVEPDLLAALEARLGPDHRVLYTRRQRALGPRVRSGVVHGVKG